jgi:DNA-binding GntR family transcriptional regulator
MKALERHQLAPGQRLVETELAAQYGVGRNAVRESIQWLSAHGVIDVTRFRSAAIRQLDLSETLDVLEIAEPLLGLIARRAAQNYRPEPHQDMLATALCEVEQADDAEMPGSFGRGRRHFYQAIIEISGNREMRRLFPALGLHILYAQYRAAAVQWRRREDFTAMAAAICRNDEDGAEALGCAHIQQVRAGILAAQEKP